MVVLQICLQHIHATSTILNVDTKSLSDQVQGDYYGYINTGMELRGSSLVLTAVVSNVRLISDLGANLIGSFYIPNPNSGNHPKFETGTKTFTLLITHTNDQENTDTFGEDNLYCCWNFRNSSRKYYFY